MTADDRALVDALRARAADNESVVYSHRVYAEMDALARRFGLTPSAVLEIGPGANLGSLFCFAAAGAARVAGVDVAPLRGPAPDFYETLRDYLAGVEGIWWWRPWAEEASILPVLFPTLAVRGDPMTLVSRIEYQSPVSSERLPFGDASFDLVFSVAALEHVANAAGTLDEIRRTLAPGGLAIHEIDLKHHGSPDPLRFLEWSDAEYSAKAEAYGGDRSLERILDGSWTGEVFCNRLRASDWIRLFSRAGLDLLLVEPVVVLEESAVAPDRFAECFRSRDVSDLAVLVVRFVARRPS